MDKLCICFRKVDKRGKTCCQMCWISRGSGIVYGHSRLCNRRNPVRVPERYNGQ